MNDSTPTATQTTTPRIVSRTWRTTTDHRGAGENWGTDHHTVRLTRTEDGRIIGSVDGEMDGMRAVRVLNGATLVDVLEAIPADHHRAGAYMRAASIHAAATPQAVLAGVFPVVGA